MNIEHISFVLSKAAKTRIKKVCEKAALPELQCFTSEQIIEAAKSLGFPVEEDMDKTFITDTNGGITLSLEHGGIFSCRREFTLNRGGKSITVSDHLPRIDTSFSVPETAEEIFALLTNNKPQYRTKIDLGTKLVTTNIKKLSHLPGVTIPNVVMTIFRVSEYPGDNWITPAKKIRLNELRLRSRKFSSEM